mmetsp:Transcript_614/g.1915  ORF Transcript_614/g.1915 Transcript_614/m.1915 type:complete len:326 (-) Transcript_614:977-1954(-)
MSTRSSYFSRRTWHCLAGETASLRAGKPRMQPSFLAPPRNPSPRMAPLAGTSSSPSPSPWTAGKWPGNSSSWPGGGTRPSHRQSVLPADMPLPGLRPQGGWRKSAPERGPWSCRQGKLLSRWMAPRVSWIDSAGLAPRVTCSLLPWLSTSGGRPRTTTMVGGLRSFWSPGVWLACHSNREAIFACGGPSRPRRRKRPSRSRPTLTCCLRTTQPRPKSSTPLHRLGPSPSPPRWLCDQQRPWSRDPAYSSLEWAVAGGSLMWRETRCRRVGRTKGTGRRSLSPWSNRQQTGTARGLESPWSRTPVCSSKRKRMSAVSLTSKQWHST